MALVPATNTHFTQSGGTPNLIAVPAGTAVTVTSVGDTLYYKSTSDVTSDSSDGTIATAASATFTTPQWIITATGISTEVFTASVDGFSDDVRFGDDVTVADTATITGATTQTGVITPSTGIAPISQPASIPADVGLPVAATTGTDTAFADGTTFLTSVFVPANFTATEIGYLVGSVGGTDKVIARLYSSAGALLASSTVAASGTTAGTAAELQEIAFTSTYAATGPRRYFIGISANGNTAKIRTKIAQTGGKAFTGSVTLTHAATTAVTPPTAFAADKGPFAYLY